MYIKRQWSDGQREITFERCESKWQILHISIVDTIARLPLKLLWSYLELERKWPVANATSLSNFRMGPSVGYQNGIATIALSGTRWYFQAESLAGMKTCSISIQRSSRIFSGRRITQREYYAYRVHISGNESRILHRVGRLFQEYIVDAYAQIEYSDYCGFVSIKNKFVL